LYINSTGLFGVLRTERRRGEERRGEGEREGERKVK